MRVLFARQNKINRRKMRNCEMVKLVFSDPQLAFDNGLEYFHQEEETVYVTEVNYPSGVEYHLKKSIIPGQEYKAVFNIDESHKFKNFDKAIKALKKFKTEGKKLCVKKKYKEENGYKFVKHFYLCSI